MNAFQERLSENVCRYPHISLSVMAAQTNHEPFWFRTTCLSVAQNNPCCTMCHQTTLKAECLYLF